MDINIIQEMIEDLENSELTLSNARSLAALYTIQDKLKNKPKDSVTHELDDILPSYTYYIESKRKYQRKEVTEETVIEDITDVCREIKEFIQMLYSCTDMNKERKQIKLMIEELHRKYEE